MDTDARIRLFLPIARLSKPLQDRAVALARVSTFARGQTVYAQGESDDLVHYLLAGTIELIWHGRVTRTLSATHKSALRALDPPGRKRYSVRALDAATIVAFKRVLLDRLLGEAEALDDAELEVNEIATERSSDWMIRMLQSELFSVLPATNIQRIFARMEQLPVSAGQVIVHQGSPGDFYYVIEKGFCEVSRAISGGRGRVHLADLGPGAAFGEEALISSQPRNASVTMLSDGLLMRLHKDDFIELILEHVLKPVSFATAQHDVEAGAVWLDIRYPEHHAAGAFAASENIPVNMLRLQSNRLRKDFHYIVCSDDVEQCAIGAFLLGERGFDVAFLDEPVTALGMRNPELLVRAGTGAPAVTPNIVHFPGAELSAPLASGETSSADLGEAAYADTLSRIAGLSTLAEAERDMQHSIPVAKYADTATGLALAEIIEELSDQHAQLDPAERNPYVGQELERDTPRAPLAAADETAPRDPIAALMQEMETRLRREVANAVAAQSALVAADHRAKLTRVREQSAEEIKRKEQQLRESLAKEYKEKEQLLRSYYKKLIALANRISKPSSRRPTSCIAKSKKCANCSTIRSRYSTSRLSATFPISSSHFEVCAYIRHPHFDSPQFKHVRQLSSGTTALA